MTSKEVIECAAKNPVFALATTDGGRPRVRMMMLYRADDNGLIFTTGRDKDVNRQLQANPAVEMCFYDAAQGREVRIEGAVEMLNDLKLKKQIVKDFPFLKPWVESQGYDVMATYRLKGGKAVTWTMETNFEPKQYIQL